MNVALSEEQELLRASAREFLGRECPPATVRAWMESPRAVSEALWKQIAGLGWPGLVLAEEHGGAGLGAVELSLLLEETGRALLPGPLFATLVLGALPIAELGSEAQRRDLLPALAAGRLRVTGSLEPGDDALADACVRARRAKPGWRLDGARRFVLDADTVDRMVVAARLESEPSPALFLVDPRTRGVGVRRVDHADPTRSFCELVLEDVAVGDEALLGDAPAAPAAYERVLDLARVALCAEMCGSAERALELSLAFAKTREQFGRPIGSFQAVAHRCADMLVRVEAARSATCQAAWMLAEAEPEGHVAACMAKSYCSEACPAVAGDAIQIHGGLGFTWDQDLHLHYKRTKTNALLLGNVEWCREEIARSLLDARISRVKSG